MKTYQDFIKDYQPDPEDGSYSIYEEDYSSSSYYWKHYPVVPNLPSQTIL